MGLGYADLTEKFPITPTQGPKSPPAESLWGPQLLTQSSHLLKMGAVGKLVKRTLEMCGEFFDEIDFSCWCGHHKGFLDSSEKGAKNDTFFPLDFDHDFCCPYEGYCSKACIKGFLKHVHMVPLDNLGLSWDQNCVNF